MSKSSTVQVFRSSIARTGTPVPLIDHVTAACQRLAQAGWADLFSAHGLNILASDLAAELHRELPDLDRAQPGFEDFALEGRRGIEPGRPSCSLLFHAFASPEVTHLNSATGCRDLKEFPTAAEIEAVENYVYGALLPSVEDLRARAGG
ncbi:MAG: hypothetical protein HYS05_00600, partial [Acidobacteria bacterium]|nr:hypothetical protein [Acidobacteriota bacterium]